MSPILGIWASSKPGAPATSFESIATVTVGSGGSSSVEFTSIPSTYKHLQIRMIARASSSQYTQGGIGLRFNADTGSNYSWHVLRGDGSTALAEGLINFSYMGLGEQATSATSSNVFSGLVVDILDYENTNKYKTLRSLGGFDANGSGYITLASGNWRNTNAITSIKLFYNLDNQSLAQYTHFALYGIKGAA